MFQGEGGGASGSSLGPWAARRHRASAWVRPSDRETPSSCPSSPAERANHRGGLFVPCSTLPRSAIENLPRDRRGTQSRRKPADTVSTKDGRTGPGEGLVPGVGTSVACCYGSAKIGDI